MFSNLSMENFASDLFNRNRNRNERNTSQWDYNCGGYALGTFSWYLPNDNDDVEDFWGCQDHSYEEMVSITRTCVDWMLDDFDDLRIIHRLSEVRHDEYAIAFRVSSDGDFHYIKQGKFRTWTHKCGMGCINTITRWEVFHTHWNDRYDGPIVLFAKKRG